MDWEGGPTQTLSRPDSTFGHTKAPTSRQGLVWNRGLTEIYTVVRLGIVKLTVIANHIFLTLIADILKLQFVTVQYLLIDNSVIRVLANHGH